MEQELLIRRDASSAAYQLARDELARLQGQGARTELESKILDDALMAYDLESMLRGYANRIYKGELPRASWLEEIQGAWKFYKSDIYLPLHGSIHKSWPKISSYEKSVIEFESAIISYLSGVLNR
jgi:hypothetical protein